MKRLLLSAGLTLILVCFIAVLAFASPEAEIYTKLESIWNTDWSPDGKYITFKSNQDIYIVEIASGILKNLTENNDFICTYPVFSGDGSEVYFSQYHHLFGEMPQVKDRIVSIQAINIETGETNLVVESAYAADLSHDGRYLVYNKDWAYRAIFDIQTGEEQIFDISDATDAPFYDNGMSDISPDNSYFITTYLNFNRVPDAFEMNSKWSAFKVDIATGETEKMNLGDLSYWYPQFSPDGSKLLLSQIDFIGKTTPVTENSVRYFQDGTAYNVVEWYQSEEANCWIKDPKTGEYVHPTMENFWTLVYDQEVYRKTDDGEFVSAAYSMPKFTDNSRPNFQVAIYDFAEDKITQSIESGKFETKMASWSPDGSKICYVMYDRERTNWSIYIYNLENGTHKIVVNGDNAIIDPTAVENTPAPVAFAITGNYPNPFNPSTTIEFSLEKAGDVRLDIYNIMGQKVRELVSEALTAGSHSVVWDGRDSNGVAVSSGVYISRLKMGEQVQTNQMMFVK